MTRDPEIRTTDAAPGDVLIQLSYPHGDGVQRVDLTLRDQVSGQIVAAVQMTPTEWTAILSTVGTVVSGVRLPIHPERIGRRMRHASVLVPPDRTAAEVQGDFLAEGWESVTVERTNRGQRVVARRWVADEPRTDAEEV